MGAKARPGRATVLAVDDKHANLMALDAVLGDEYDMLFASSGAEAISLIESGRNVDVILMDVQMPEMDGFEAASHILQMEQGKELPIIFITAEYREDPHVKRGYEVGGVDYFSKPFDPEILKRKVALYAAVAHKSYLLEERERSVRESEELLAVGRKLSSVLESLPVGVLIADSEGVVCQSTETVSTILRSVEPTRSDTYGVVIGWWDESGRMLKREDGPLARALHRGEASHNERIEIRCCDGTPKTILASASPLRMLDGRIAGAVVLIQDVTEHRKIERDLEDRVARLIGMELEERSEGSPH